MCIRTIPSEIPSFYAASSDRQRRMAADDRSAKQYCENRRARSAGYERRSEQEARPTSRVQMKRRERLTVDQEVGGSSPPSCQLKSHDKFPNFYPVFYTANRCQVSTCRKPQYLSPAAFFPRHGEYHPGHARGFRKTPSRYLNTGTEKARAYCDRRDATACAYVQARGVTVPEAATQHCTRSARAAA
jgi:hypothetical protein